MPVLASLLSSAAAAFAAEPGPALAPPPDALEWPSEASPTALAASPDGKQLFVACATVRRVAVFDTGANRVTHGFDVPEPPSGLALARDGRRLYVACAAPTSPVCVVDVPSRTISARLLAGHTAMSPLLSPDERTLYVCNRFNHDVSVFDLAAGREVKRIGVEREPVAAALTPDGRHLLVANHLHAGPANNAHAVAKVSVIDTRTGCVTRNIPLALGSSLLRGIAVSPDGRFAAVTHLRSLFWLYTTGVELGRMNCNALTVLDLNRFEVLGVLLLDQTARGAANPWAVSWTPDGRTVAVTHAGAHELSLVDAPVVADPKSFFSLTIGAYASQGTNIPAPPRHPVRVRKRVSLPGEGPRALAAVGSQLYVANYFSDNLCRIDLETCDPVAEPLPLTPARQDSVLRRGERLFNDARLCSQGWQSCASCHDADARTDALNWDLLNDGVGNPKNTRSLVGSHATAPAMSLGVRASAAAAVRAGIHHILFSDQPEEVPAAMEAWLASLPTLPSPRLVDGQLSPAAQRGRKLFMSDRTGCADCHPPPLYTDQSAYDVGTAVKYAGMLDPAGADKPSDRFDTPTLLELWRTGPYLHDGSAVTLQDVLTTRNPNDRHGSTSGLTPEEIDDLAQYLLSL